MSQARHKTRRPGIYTRHAGSCLPDRENCEVKPDGYQASWLDSQGVRRWAAAPTEAEARRRQREGQGRADCKETEVRRDRMTVAQFVEGPWAEHLDEQVALRAAHPDSNPPSGIKPNTGAFYKDGARRLCGEIGYQKRLQSITGKMLTDALARADRRRD